MATDVVHHVPERVWDAFGNTWDEPGWYFWDESWATRHGPFRTRADARVALNHYIRTVLHEEPVPPKLECIPEYGDHMTVQAFLAAVGANALTDDDGFGQWATSKGMSEIVVSPSSLTYVQIPNWATHIVWFNK